MSQQFNPREFFRNLPESEYIKLIKGLDSHGFSSIGGPDPLNKAFDGFDVAGDGSVTDIGSMTDGRAVIFENQDQSIVRIMQETADYPLANKLIRSNMKSIYDRFTRQTEFGNNAGMRNYGAWKAETDMPTDHTSHLADEFGVAKFIRDSRSRSHVYDNTGNKIKGADQINNRDAAQFCLDTYHKTLLYGNADVNPLEFTGFVEKLTQASTDSTIISNYNLQESTVLDLRDAVLEAEHINTAAKQVFKNYGLSTDLFLSPDLRSYMDNEWLLNTTRLAGKRNERAYHGVISEGMNSAWSRNNVINYTTDRHIMSGADPMSLAPAVAMGTAPAIGALSGAAATGVTDSKFVAGDAGAYRYKVVAMTASGATLATDVTSSAFTVVAGGSIEITMGVPSSGTNPTGYMVYRSAKGAASTADCRYIGSVAFVTGGADTVFVDLNHTIPGTGIALLLDLDTQGKKSFQFRQLMPFFSVKMPFAQSGYFAYTTSYGLYGYLQFPRMSGVLIKNIQIPGSGF